MTNNETVDEKMNCLIYKIFIYKPINQQKNTNDMQQQTKPTDLQA